MTGIRTVRFAYPSGNEEDVQIISESGLYRVLHRYARPDRALRRWLTHEAIPILRDSQATTPHNPRRTQMHWASQQVNVLEWQGELRVPLNSLPWFGRTGGKAALMGRRLWGRLLR